MPGEKPAFLSHVHSFRGVAILAVVATHALYDLQWAESDLVWQKFSVSLFQNGTVPFVFIAGFLFQHRLSRFAYRSYLWTKLRFVLLPYFLVSLPYVFWQKASGFGLFAAQAPRTFDSDIAHVAVAFLTGDQMPIPLWFVPMITVFYVCAPAFAWLDRHPRSYLVIVPALLLASFAHRPQHQTHLSQTLPYFLPVYLAGMCASHHHARVLALTRQWRWGLVAAMAACLAFEIVFRERAGAIESARAFSTERGVFDVNSYFKLALSLVLLDALRGAGPRLSRCLAPLAELSFGIFFVHFYFIHGARSLRAWLGWAPWPGSVLAVLGYTLLLVLLSMALVLGLRALLGRRSRYLVGC